MERFNHFYTYLVTQSSADLQTTLWMPYIGAMLHGPSFRAKLIVTPYTWAQTKIPFRYLFVFLPGVFGSEDIRYTFNKGGFLHGRDR